MSPSRRTPAGEAPTSGAIDATYSHRNGSVELRKLELHLPASDLEAHGTLGAYPISGPSALTIDFHSHNLGEFDTALRSLGVKREGRSGARRCRFLWPARQIFMAYGPVRSPGPTLRAQSRPRNLRLRCRSNAGSPNPQSSYISILSRPTGSYSPSQIAIQHAATRARQYAGQFSMAHSMLHPAIDRN